MNRARVDLRDLDGEFSTRSRGRLGIEREFTVGGVTLVPSAHAEVFYDDRFGAWNRQLIPLRGRHPTGPPPLMVGEVTQPDGARTSPISEGIGTSARR